MKKKILIYGTSFDKWKFIEPNNLRKKIDGIRPVLRQNEVGKLVCSRTDPIPSIFFWTNISS